MIAMNEKANMTKVMAVIAMMAVVFAGVAVLASDSTDAADSKITYISGEINADTEFGPGTIVVVNGNLTIVNGATLSILDGSKFTVNEGVTLTVNGLDAENNKAVFSVANGADVTVNGDITVGENGDLQVTGKMVANGTITFQSGTNALTGSGNGEIVLGEGAALNVTSTGTKIGKIGAVTISLMPGATVNMRGMTVGEVIVNAVPADYLDEDFDSDNAYGASVKISANPYDESARITSTKVSNIVITSATESATAYVASGADTTRVTVQTSTLDISGTIQNGDDITTTTDAVETAYTDRNDEPLSFSPAVTVSQSLTVGKTATITVDSVFNVAGTVNVITNDEVNNVIAHSVMIEANAEITVTGTASFACDSVEPAAGKGSLKVLGGTVTIIGCDDPTDLQIGELYGAYYTAVEGINYTTYIMDLEDAIAAAGADDSVTDVFVYSSPSASAANKYKGAYTVSEGFTVPAGITLHVYNVLVVPEDIEITVPVDAGVEAVGMIVVDGKVIDSSLTLDLVENGAGVVCEVTITADEGATITYTSLALAIAGASAGDVIDLAGDATIDSNLTIPADITVVVGNHSMTVTEGAVLTVDGVLDNTEGTVKTTYDSEKQNPTGTVTVNNLMITADGAAYNAENFNISGVYFDADIEGVEGSHFIASVPTFAGYSADVTGEANVMGKVTVNEDITLTAGENNTDYILNIAGTAVFSTVNIEGYGIEISGNGIMTGTVAAGENSVSLNSIKAESGIVSITNVVDEDEGTSTLNIAGTPASVDKDGNAPEKTEDNVATLTIASGTATVSNAFDAKNLVSFGVSEGTTLDVSGNLGVSEFAISGTVNVLDKGIVNATNIIVTGTLNVTAVDENNATGGAVNADGNVYIGTDDEFKTQNAATFTGDIAKYQTAYVSAESTVTGDFTEDSHSEFYIEDTLWMTAYGTTATIADAPVENAVFNGWVNPEIENMEPTKDPITIATNERLDADIEYDIYSVQVIADNGVGTVAIDGNVLIKSSNAFIYNGFLAAGSHTISIDVKNGYSADNVVIQVNGQTISGNTFTLSGTPEAGESYVTVTITVSGTEATVQEPVVEDDGMGITDYLLIILVILVIVLAIFVALRMMRS